MCDDEIPYLYTFSILVKRIKKGETVALVQDTSARQNQNKLRIGVDCRYINILYTY